MIPTRYGRWLVLICVAALVSCMMLPTLNSQDAEHQSSVIQPEQSTIVTPLNAQETWVLRFPKHWVENNQCHLQGTNTMIVTKTRDRLEGRLPWIWNGMNDAAHLTGTMSGDAITMTLQPPPIGGFALIFEGIKATYNEGEHHPGEKSQEDTEAFAGQVSADGMCRRFNSTFTLTPIKRLTPSPDVKQTPFFYKPFELEFLTTNYFDHNVPRQFQDDNGYLVSWDGQQRPIGSPGAGIDGHGGYDWVLPEGTPLLAVADGIVYGAGEGQSFFCPPLNRETSGLELSIDHQTPNGDRLVSEYLHLSRIDVLPGQSVKAGQVIGLSGNTGCSTGPHLHFGVYRLTKTQQWILVDPFGWNATSPDPWSKDSFGNESMWLWQDNQAPVLYEYGR